MKTPQILIVGSSGFLGSVLKDELKKNNLTLDFWDRTTVDLIKPLPINLERILKDGAYEYAIICAAISDVERCFKNKDMAYQVNVTGTISLLKLLQRANVIPVFFSSDYVFAPATDPHRESDRREPETQYGKQKLIVEQYLEDNFKHFLIFRTSKLMSKTAHPRNILYPIIESLRSARIIKCYVDQWLNPVFVEDIADVLLAAMRKQLHGIYHLGTRRIFTRYELAEFLANQLSLNPSSIIKIKLSDVTFSEKRPNHNLLNCHKIEDALGFRFKEIEEEISNLTFVAIRVQQLHDE